MSRARIARMELVGHGGIRLVADQRGAGPDVLLLHGGGQTRHAWGGAAQALAAHGFRSTTVDLRGHGDSQWSPDGDYSYDAFSGDVVALCRELDRPAVVGASLGGLAALEASREGPELMSALVLVDITPRLEPDGVVRIMSFMADRPNGFASLDEAADAIASYMPHRPRPADPSGLAKNLRLGDDGRWRWHWDPRFISSDRRPNAAHRADELMDRARALTVPTLLVRGRMSDIVSEAGAREFLDAVPHAEYVDIADAAHMVAGDENDAFAGAVIEFLQRVRA
jgi:pimeloyl-ACP methyl ester carboxylesterase